MDLGRVVALNGVLERFVAEVFVPDQPVRGAERRAELWAHHVRGSLLTDIERKTATGMGRVLGVPTQSLNHLVTDSPWQWKPVRARIAVRAQALLRPRAWAWAIDDTTFLKDGHDTVGVARQHSGRAGGIANCQAAVTVTAVGRTGGTRSAVSSAIPLDWRLFMPKAWDPEVSAERRLSCRVPDEVAPRRKWELALDGLDRLLTLGLTAPPILADHDYGKVGAFRDGLADRGLGFVVQVNTDVSLLGWRTEPDTPWSREGKHQPATALAAQIPTSKKVAVSWHTSEGEQAGRFSLLHVREAGIKVRQQASKNKTTLPDRWLLIAWDENGEKPTHFWLAHLPDITKPSLQRLVRLAKARWGIETGYRELKDTLGLDHYEGRTWPGWHRHVTLVTAALLFLTEHRATATKHTAPA